MEYSSSVCLSKDIVSIIDNNSLFVIISNLIIRSMILVESHLFKVIPSLMRK